MLSLTGPTGQRLEDIRSLDLEFAAAESNVSVGLARLGWRAGWVSRLPDHAVGHSILRALPADGVEVSAVKSVPASSERVGTYYIEYASPPHSAQVIYDHADSAASRITTAEVDWDYLLDTRVLHLTCIKAALSENCYTLYSSRRFSAPIPPG